MKVRYPAGRPRQVRAVSLFPLFLRRSEIRTCVRYILRYVLRRNERSTTSMFNMHTHWEFGRHAYHRHGGRPGFMGRFAHFMGGMGGGGVGRGFRAARMLASGDLQLIVLALLDQKAAARLRDHQGARRTFQRRLHTQSRRRLSRAHLLGRGGPRGVRGHRQQKALCHHRRRQRTPRQAPPGSGRDAGATRAFRPQDGARAQALRRRGSRPRLRRIRRPGVRAGASGAG